MLWPASHLERKRLEYDVYCADTCRSYLLERDERAMAEMAVPACPAGGLLIFDFRLQHRGMPNTSGRERAIAHAVLATGGAFDKLGADASPSLIDAVDARVDEVHVPGWMSLWSLDEPSRATSSPIREWSDARR